MDGPKRQANTNDGGASRPLREQIMEVTRKAHWIPDFGLARELDWLTNMHDWMISKKRYYGLALPIFECKQCGKFELIGSEHELKERAIEGWEQFEGHSPHRPYIDAIRIACSSCGASVPRIKDVGNPWLDAGIVPFSTLHLRDGQDYWRQWFPADWVSESFPGQFRNWFYSLLAMGTVMVQGTEYEGKPPFRTLFSYALVRDEKGEEMHKSKGNAIWFEDAAERMGADVMWWMYLRTNPANNLNFGWAGGDEIKRGFLSTLWNTYSFFVTYANIDGWRPARSGTQQRSNDRSRPDLDRWALSELNQLVRNVTGDLQGFDSMAATRRIESFIENLSNWYVRRSRRRFWKSENDADKVSAYETLWTCLVTLDQVMAPMLPFLAEEMYQNLVVAGGSSLDVAAAQKAVPESVHLTAWPVADEALIDEELSESIRLVQRLASLGRAARASANVKVRQPLQTVFVKVLSHKEQETIRIMADQLLEELNVKEVRVIENETEYFDYQVRPNLPVLDPKYGGEVGRIQRALATADKVEIAKAVEAGRQVRLEDFTLDPSELLLSRQGRSGYAAAVEAGYAVVVTTTVTPELADEGFARELVRRIQEIRKNAGLNISDRIRLTYRGNDFASVMQSWGCYIAAEILADSIESAEPPEGAYAEDHEIDRREVTLSVKRKE